MPTPVISATPFGADIIEPKFKRFVKAGRSASKHDTGVKTVYFSTQGFYVNRGLWHPFHMKATILPDGTLRIELDEVKKSQLDLFNNKLNTRHWYEEIGKQIADPRFLSQGRFLNVRRPKYPWLVSLRYKAELEEPELWKYEPPKKGQKKKGVSRSC